MAMQEIRKRSLDLAASRVETSDDANAPNGRIVGYAAVFDTWTVLSRSKTAEGREIIRPGAFDVALAESDDVVMLIEHDHRLIVARTRAGTLRLSVDDYGLRFEADLPDTTRARDLRADILAGNYDGASFGYLPRPGGETITKRTENGVLIVESEITSAYLTDVSVVGSPAYQGTAVETRSSDPSRSRKRLILLDSRARLDAIKHRISH